VFEAVALSGGGMRGIASIGALVELRRAGWLDGARTFAGTSVGAVLAALLAINADLEATFVEHVLNFEYTSSYDLAGLDKTFGLDTGEGLAAWIDRVLRGQRLTFQDIRNVYGATLLVCASNLNTRDAVVFGPDTHPDMDVATALRMSCSIPLYFAAVTYEGELYVDGAITDNMPIGPAGAGGKRVLGVRLKTRPRPAGAPWTLDGFLGAIVECAVHGPVPPCVDAVVMDVDAGEGSQPASFKMPRRQMQRIYDAGRAQARDFMMTFRKKSE
jgi:predicted acylesterase/phospholipase RssA